MAKKILIVNPGSKYKLKFLEHIFDLGYQIVLLTNNTELDKKITSLIAPEDLILTDLDDFEGVKKEVDKYLKHNRKPDGIFTYWERDTMLTAKLAEHFGFASTSAESISQASRDKFVMHKKLEESGLVTYKATLVDDLNNLKDVAKQFDFPVVIKPVAGASSKGVIKINNLEEINDEFINKYKKITDINSDDIHKYSANKYLLAEYLKGTEYSIEGYIYNGKPYVAGIVEKMKMNENSFIEVGDRSIPNLNKRQKVAIAEYIKSCVKELGLNNTLFHAEAKYNHANQEINLIEVNPRVGGDYIWEFVSESYGVDLIDIGLRIATDNIDFKLSDRYLHDTGNFLIGSYFLPERSGTVVEVTCNSSKVSESNIYQLVLPEIGLQVGTPPDRYDYLGWAIVKSEDKEKLEGRIKNAHSSVHIGIA